MSILNAAKVISINLQIASGKTTATEERPKPTDIVDAELWRRLGDSLNAFDERSLLNEFQAAVAVDGIKEIASRRNDSIQAHGSEGRRRLQEKSDAASLIKKNIYERIGGEKKPGFGAKAILAKLKNERQFVEQVSDAGLKLDFNLVRAGIKWFEDNSAVVSNHKMR